MTFKMDIEELSREELIQILHYDPQTGLFTWIKSSRNGWVGKTAGWSLNNDYIAISLLDRTVLAHRLAWFYHHGEWPKGEIDHKDRNRSNNKISNLRDVPKTTNQANVPVRSDSSSGHTGVNWHAKKKAWIARIQREGRRHTLGAFPTIDLAVAARAAADVEHRKIERMH